MGNSPATAETTAAKIGQAKDATERAAADLRKTFAAVPDDKLDWSPSPTARTPLWLVGHCGAASSAIAALLRGEPLPLPGDTADAAALIRAAGQGVATRAEALSLLDASTAEVLAALDSVTPARVETVPDSPFGQMPFAFWMEVPANHTVAHARQLDYLQTIWGDLQDH
jgi:hypothetical protein